MPLMVNIIKNKIFALTALISLGAIFLLHSKYHAYSTWLLGSYSLLIFLWLLWEAIESLRLGEYSLNLVSMTTILGAIILKKDWIAIIIIIGINLITILKQYKINKKYNNMLTTLLSKNSMVSLIKNRKTSKIYAKNIQIGNTITLSPGEVVPADAIIIKGSSKFKLPFQKEVLKQYNPTDTILMGSINETEPVTIKTIAQYKDSRLSLINKYYEIAKGNNSQLIKQINFYNISFSVLITILAFVTWYLNHSSSRFLDILIAFFVPTALYATPLIFRNTIENSIRENILFKSYDTIESLARSKYVAFCKSKLTISPIAVMDIITVNQQTKTHLLALAASLENNYDSDIAQAIIKAAKDKAVKPLKLPFTNYHPSLGIESVYQGQKVIIGSLNYLKKNKTEFPKNFKPPKSKDSKIYVAQNNILLGYLVLENKFRDDSKKAVEALNGIDINTIILSSEQPDTIQKLAVDLNIKIIYADLLLKDKVNLIESMKNKGVVYIGNTENDNIPLTTATTSIILGLNNHKSLVENSGVILFEDKLNKLSEVFLTARNTIKSIYRYLSLEILISLFILFILIVGYINLIEGAIIRLLIEIIMMIWLMTINQNKVSRVKLSEKS